jgi:hypothetical protein
MATPAIDKAGSNDIEVEHASPDVIDLLRMSVSGAGAGAGAGADGDAGAETGWGTVDEV